MSQYLDPTPAEFWNKARRALAVVLLAALAAVVSCRMIGCGPRPAHPVSPAISDPLARIPVRQGVIKQAAPDLPVVRDQADATIADVELAQAELGQLGRNLEAERAAWAKERGALEADLAKAQSDTERNYRRWVNAIRVLCIVGIGGGLVLAVMVGPKWGILPVACVAMLAAVAVEGFVYRWAQPIAGVTLGLLAVYGLWWLFVHKRATRDLVKSGQLLIHRAGGIEAVAPDLNKLQCRITRAMVNRTQKQLRLRN